MTVALVFQKIYLIKINCLDSNTIIQAIYNLSVFKILKIFESLKEAVRKINLGRKRNQSQSIR